MDEQLIAAIESGDTQRVRELLETGANPNAKKGYNTAYQLVPYGKDDIKCALIEAGANDSSLRHSLVWAVGTGRVETVKALIKKGADVNMASVGLGSPLQSAAREGNLEIVDVLIAAGADVDDSNTISTPLLTAIEKGHERYINFSSCI
ncbi:ankyrin [Calothrix sp. NIES-4071]|nr:ankyrin [Calothrix sp. NIES-4071]BAZ58194.1 ankyrin [Calothrix sp. NIES-4105]